MKRTLVTLLLLALVSSGAQNLLNEGSLKGKLPRGIEMTLGKGGPDFRVTGGNRMMRYRIALPEKAKSLNLTMQVRTDGCIRGDAGWKNARLDLQFIGRDGKRVGPWLKTFAFTGTHGWVFCEREYAIPADAVFIDVIPANYGKAGTIELKQVRLVPDTALEGTDLPLPDGLSEEAVFSLKDAERISTRTRDKVTLNGLWQFLPVFKGTAAETVPCAGSGWGWFKVPASFPELTQRAMGPGANNNIVYLPGKIRQMAKKEKIREAWYRRKIAIPSAWSGRRIRLLIDMLQSVGTVYIDGRKAGSLVYPGGALDLTGHLLPGRTHELSIFVSAKPAALSTFMGETRMYQSFRDLNNRGLCGDIELEAIPVNCGISDVLVISSVAEKTITFDTGFLNLPDGSYRLKAVVSDVSGTKKIFQSKIFSGSGKRVSFSSAWSDPKLWDIDTPQNLYTLRLELLSSDGDLLDAFYPEEFGFREFSMRGRHFYLNGKKLQLHAAAVTNTRYPAKATDEMLAHMIRVYRKFHVNFLLEGIYDFAPGTCCYNAAYWRATSKAGILTSMSMPHVKNFNFDLKNPVHAAEYRRIAEHQIRRYQNIPGIILFATSHNAMGYADQQNPERIGTSSSGKTGLTPFSRNRRNQALLAEAILNRIDPSRPVYHHSSGNLGTIFSINCYLNWAPVQERSDWLELWEKQGDLPLFFVEYGPPHKGSYTSERGPQFLWAGSYSNVHCLWFNEFNAACLGEKAYRSDPAKEKFYRFEESQVKGNRKNKPLMVQIPFNFPDSHEVRSHFLRRNLFDFRARGLSGIILWDFESLFRKLEKSRPAVPNPDRFRNLKRSAIVNDIICIKDGGSTCDWFWPNDPLHRYAVTPTGDTVRAAWRPLTARIKGKLGEFTEQPHTFRPGETVRKSLVILNDTRQTQIVRCTWQVPGLVEKQTKSVSVPPGERMDLPVEFDLPASSSSGEQKILAEFHYADGSSEKDSFTFTVLPEKRIRLSSTLGVLDPEGSARTLLKRLGVSARTVGKESDLAGVDLLILGRKALSSLPFPLDRHLEKGLKLLVLEQSSESLNRIGFRTNEIGLRRVFPVSGFSGGVLRDWRGKATLLPQYMPPQKLPSYPMTDWSGFMNRRIWRAGNRGTVASVLPEKPAIGNFLPLYQGGFDLQYAPLMEFREKKAVILFCQLDLSGRTEEEGEANNLLASLLERLEKMESRPARKVWYTGNDALRKQLDALRIPAEKLAENLSSGDLLVIGPEGKIPENLTELLRDGLHVMTVGLSGAELKRIIPGIQTESGSHYSDFSSLAVAEFAGLSNADLHFRWAQNFDAFPADSSGGRTLEFRTVGSGKIVMLQIPPWKIDGNEYALRSSRRRADFAMNRLLMNLGAGSESGLLRMFRPENGNLRLSLSGIWRGKEDPEKAGRKKKYYAPAFSAEGWRSIRVPGSFESQFKALEKYDGWFWYRLEFQVPRAMTVQETVLSLGAVDDESWIWLNGKLLGEVSRKTNPKNYWSAERICTIPPHTLNVGKNTLCVLCNDLGKDGGILGIPALRSAKLFSLYPDSPIANDDPYRYFHW